MAVPAATSSASREERLAEVLAEFARTLGKDFSIQAILDRLVRRMVHVLPVTAAGVLLGNEDGLGFVAASNATILKIESAQREFAEGPCLECLVTGTAVGVPDLTTDTRFPRFSTRAAQSGMAAVFTFPLRINGQLLGALDLYRDQPGDLDPGDARAAGTLADVAAAYLYNARVRAEAATSLDALRHSTLHDALTGLANRTLFAELLERAVGKARRSHCHVAVLFVDLDRFKSVNDRFGHHVGDLLLIAVADRLHRAVRPGDTLARFAGDEFVILAEELTDAAQADAIAGRVTALLTEPFVVDRRPIDVTASVGIAYSGPGIEVPEALLHDADFAMYQAKAAGGGQHQVVDRGARLAADERAHLEGDLRAALRANRLQLAYQPIVDSGTGTIVGAEALLRWHDEGRGWVPPDVIIPLAERVGLIEPIGRWALSRACTDFVSWRRGPLAPRHISVNVSPQQIIRPTFADDVARAIADTGIRPDQLHLEVTESALLDGAATTCAVLADVKGSGVRLSLDDFGTGYASLTYLKCFPFDEVKIDGSFTADLGVDPATRLIVEAVTNLAHALGLIVVAEGVETPDQLHHVQDLGGDLVQGFLISRPLQLHDFERDVLQNS